MTKIRIFKKTHLLSITLRDILGHTDLSGSMDELTFLAETIIDAALQCAIHLISKRFGLPSSGAKISIIALGKLGGEELNYSSDVDLIAVFEDNDGQTSGVAGLTGALMNKISNEEFYYKVVELLNKLLSANTEDGIAYRVDLRLRPQGAKGEIALPLSSYRTYYESWGRTWERMAMLRARPIAGDTKIGLKFIEIIDTFVWQKTIDFTEIDEIRSLKKKIDFTYSKDDIKRGYGGIREAEFFVQTFQLIYGADNMALRTHRLFNAIQSLRWTGIIPSAELTSLWENYIYLRRLEHYLQMKDDLQIHSLPQSLEDMSALGRSMGFDGAPAFLTDLRIRRMQVKNMYNALLGTKEDIHSEAMTLIEGDLSDEELIGYLSFRSLMNPSEAIGSLNRIRERFALMGTKKEITTMRGVLPELLEQSLKSPNPDRAISGLDAYISSFGGSEAYFTALMEEKTLLDGIVRMFSLSPYLSSRFLRSSVYLDLLIEEGSIRKSMSRLKSGTERYIGSNEDFGGRLVEFKSFEEIRLGIYFLLNIMGIHDLLRYLSHMCDTALGLVLSRNSVKKGIGVVALGKLGGREVTYGSDLDIIFVSDAPDGFKHAENTMKALTSYTGKGILYNVDVRLRPEGSKGPLVNDLEGYRNYYLNNAHHWELQSLIKARPVAGDARLLKEFVSISHEVIKKKGPFVEHSEISSMRERILKKHVQGKEGIDIKFSHGGIEEIEFFIQWLILKHSSAHPDIIVQNTRSAIHRIYKNGLIDSAQKDILSQAYEYFRRLETFMRLNEERALMPDSFFAGLAGSFMGEKNGDELTRKINLLMNGVLKAIKRTKD